MSTALPAKTRDEIESLKAQWCNDACWDIEDTEGFEAYREELLAFSQQKQAEWSDMRQRDLAAFAEKLGAPGNVKLAEYVMGLERRLAEMNLALENMYFR